LHRFEKRKAIAIRVKTILIQNNGRTPRSARNQKKEKKKEKKVDLGGAKAASDN